MSILNLGNTPNLPVLSKKEIASLSPSEVSAYFKAVGDIRAQKTYTKGLGLQSERGRRLAGVEKVSMIREEVTGWAGIIKVALVIFVGLILFVGGFSAVGAIWEFIEPNLIWWALGSGLFMIIWIRR